MEAQEELRRIEEEIVEDVLRKEIPESIDENLEVARRGRNGIDAERGLKVERGSYP